MIMVGDMFNQALKHRVDTLCCQLTNLLRSQPLLNPSDASQSQSQGECGGYAAASVCSLDLGRPPGLVAFRTRQSCFHRRAK